MTTLTMRYIKGHFEVTGPDIEPAKFSSRRQAKEWCQTHYPGSPVTEIGQDASPRRAPSKAADLTLSPDDPLVTLRAQPSLPHHY
jgi:hypothetical protein